MAFTTPLTLTGPARSPRQMLEDQSYGGHSSVHDDATADALGLAGAPIEGPTHFSQFDPLAFAVWGQAWFQYGCISAHFRTMVVDGETVTASLTTDGPSHTRIDAVKADGTPVLTGTASVGLDAPTELDARLAAAHEREVDELFIVDQLSIGDRSEAPVTTSIDRDTDNGPLYPFSLARKLDGITEPSAWYDSDANPWGRPVLPIEMISVLAEKTGTDFPVRRPCIGLFLDLQVRMLEGPLFVDEDYVLEREIVGLGQSRRTESFWVRTDLTDASTGTPAASVLLHHGVFKDSYPGYPTDRL